MAHELEIMSNMKLGGSFLVVNVLRSMQGLARVSLRILTRTSMHYALTVISLQRCSM